MSENLPRGKRGTHGAWGLVVALALAGGAAAQQAKKPVSIPLCKRSGLSLPVPPGWTVTRNQSTPEDASLTPPIPANQDIRLKRGQDQMVVASLCLDGPHASAQRERYSTVPHVGQRGVTILRNFTGRSCSLVVYERHRLKGKVAALVQGVYVVAPRLECEITMLHQGSESEIKRWKNTTAPTLRYLVDHLAAE